MAEAADIADVRAMRQADLDQPFIHVEGFSNAAHNQLDSVRLRTIGGRFDASCLISITAARG